jgi:hypothetical protein
MEAFNIHADKFKNHIDELIIFSTDRFKKNKKSTKAYFIKNKNQQS